MTEPNGVPSSCPTSLKLDAETKGRVQRIANTRQRTPHWVMVEAIRQYVDREEKREQMRRDALQAWREYQETGLHATSSEVIAWLETWGEDDEQHPPECHG
jgi:predicted transcriptional regulator